MVEVLYEMESEMDLYLLSEFLESIRSELARIMDTFVTELQSSLEGVHVPPAQQMIALRRLNWLKPYFLKIIESFEKSSKSYADYHLTSVLQQCAVNARSLDWASWPIFMDLLDKHPNLLDNKGINVRSKFRQEVTEEICYGVSSKLFCPCNEAVWCGVATSLIHDLCFAIARDRWDHGRNHGRTEPSKKLSEVLMQKAVQASNAVQNPENLAVLEFDTDIWKRYSLNNRAEISNQPRGTKCVMTLADDITLPGDTLPAPTVLKEDSASAQKHIFGMIHKPWYLIRQILFVVDTFAKCYLMETESAYSFETMCEKLGLSSEIASRFLRHEVELNPNSSFYYGKNFKSVYSKGNKLPGVSGPKTPKAERKRGNNVAASKTVKKSVPNKFLFWAIVMEGLKELGWKVESGGRSCDSWYLPPGVERGNEKFRRRLDYFDSALRVINVIESDPRYCNQPAIKAILMDYQKCKIAYERMKSSQRKVLNTLSNKEKVDSLRKLTGGSPSNPISAPSSDQELNDSPNKEPIESIADMDGIKKEASTGATLGAPGDALPSITTYYLPSDKVS